MRYVPLGDSYTIGTSVGEAERWPNQLVAALDDRLELVANPAVNGYTSRDLIERELPLVGELAAEFVSVLIGVNDVVRAVLEETYARNVAHILDVLLSQVPRGRIVCVATPDYTVTPQGAAYGEPGRQRAGIVRVNALLREASGARGVAFVPEIFEISRAPEASWVAADGLHPSGAQYARWVEAIRPVVAGLLHDAA